MKYTDPEAMEVMVEVVENCGEFRKLGRGGRGRNRGVNRNDRPQLTKDQLDKELNSYIEKV